MTTLNKLPGVYRVPSTMLPASSILQREYKVSQSRGKNWFCLQFLLLCFVQFQIESNSFEADSISRSLCSTFSLMDKFKLSRKSKNKFKAFCQMPILLDFDKTAIEL